MGFFSWLTSDTQRSIPSSYSLRSTFKVHMITEDGRVFTEDNYDGYGVFGGKDFYALAAELNGFKGEDEDKTRNLFFDKIWKRGVRNDDKVLTYTQDFDNYESKIKVEGIDDEVTPNQLVRECGWVHWDVGMTGNTQDFVDAGFKMPKIVENLDTYIPNGDNPQWKQYWESLPYPESCPEQGYFYDDEEEKDTCISCGLEIENGWSDLCDSCSGDDED